MSDENQFISVNAERIFSLNFDHKNSEGFSINVNIDKVIAIAKRRMYLEDGITIELSEDQRQSSVSLGNYIQYLKRKN